MAMIAWALLVTATVGAAALAAVTVRPSRRAAGLLAATAGVAALLLMLGLDLPAAVWFGLGGAASLLILPAGEEADLGPAAAGPQPGVRAILPAGLTATMLFAVLYRTVLQVDWRSSPPAEVSGQTAVVGGRLLTADLAVALAVVLALTVALLATVPRDEPGGRP